MVLKLKTSDFRILTRSQTAAAPPASEASLADTACELRERVGLPSHTRFRLAGVGLAGLIGGDLARAQEDLFDAHLQGFNE